LRTRRRILRVAKRFGAGFAKESPKSRGMQITGIDALTYMVKDLARAIAFYRDVLQLPLAPTIGENGAEFELPDGSTFELLEPR
jgi:hypothetical protein